MRNCVQFNKYLPLSQHVPWNKGKLLGQKPPLQPKHIWSIRTQLQLADKVRDSALFNLAIDSKLRACDVVSTLVENIAPHGYAIDRATIRQSKTGRPVKFELTEQTRTAIDEFISKFNLKDQMYLFQGRGNLHLTRQYSRLVGDWVKLVGLGRKRFRTHSLRRTKAALIYKKTGSLRAVQLLLGHTKIKSTVRYLGVEVDDALEIAEKIEV